MSHWTRCFASHHKYCVSNVLRPVHVTCPFTNFPRLLTLLKYIFPYLSSFYALCFSCTVSSTHFKAGRPALLLELNSLCNFHLFQLKSLELILTVNSTLKIVGAQLQIILNKCKLYWMWACRPTWPHDLHTLHYICPAPVPVTYSLYFIYILHFSALSLHQHLQSSCQVTTSHIILLPISVGLLFHTQSLWKLICHLQTESVN